MTSPPPPRARPGSGGLAHATALAIPLPRRVPRPRRAAEPHEEPPGREVGDADGEFTAERAASSLAGFQRGTRRARQEDAASRAHPPTSPPNADR